MKKQEGTWQAVWGIISAVTAGLLLLDFLACCVLLFMGPDSLLDPVIAIVTAVFVLLGLIIYAIGGRVRVRKLWRRLLLAGIICGAAVMAALGFITVSLILYAI